MEKNRLTEGQWGDRTGHQTTNPALQKMFSFKYGRALNVMMTLFTNETTACFDHMVPNISTLVACKYGMEPYVMIAQNQVMADMEDSVRTKHGDSCGTYCDKSGDIKMSSKMQDTGSVGCLWSIKSHTFLQTHQALHEGNNLPTANGTRLI